MPSSAWKKKKLWRIRFPISHAALSKISKIFGDNGDCVWIGRLCSKLADARFFIIVKFCVTTLLQAPIDSFIDAILARFEFVVLKIFSTRHQSADFGNINKASGRGFVVRAECK